jgi:chromosome segregation ATPase
MGSQFRGACTALHTLGFTRRTEAFSYFKMGDNVKVVIRIRPLNSRELQDGSRRCLSAQVDRSAVALEAKPKAKTFTYDFVADEDITQDEIFQVVGKPITTSCLSGYNGTIFAYGQTGSGKTHTIIGPDDIAEGSLSYEERGLLPRCIEFLFASINREGRRCEGLEFLVKCSFIEIYQEQVINLLVASPAPLALREDLKLGVYVEGLTEVGVGSAAETYNVMKQGTQHRHTGETSMNKESSRSHSVFTMLIESREVKQGLLNFRSSRFHLIDLAGSERQKATEATGMRLKEAGMINKSLSALGGVINALVDIAEGKIRHVHYRDSKLTFLLKDSLGGNSKTCIVAAISPSATAFGETLSTLKFAQRAKMIRNKATVIEALGGNVELLKDQVRQLTEKLKLVQHGSGVSEYSLQAMNSRIGELEALLGSNVKLRQEMEVALQHELEVKDSMILQLSEAVDRFEKKVANYKMVLKFREAAIERLQQGLPPHSAELRQEIELLRGTVDMPPIAAKLLAENEQLKSFVESMQREQTADPYSLCHRLRENQEFTHKLAASLQESAMERAQLRGLLEELASFKTGDLIASPVKKRFEAELATLNKTGEHSTQSALLEDGVAADSPHKGKFECFDRSRLSSLLEESSIRLNRTDFDSFNDSLNCSTLVRALRQALKDAARASSLETELESCRQVLERKELELADLTEQLEVIYEAHEFLKDQYKTVKTAHTPSRTESAEVTRLWGELRGKEEAEEDLKQTIRELQAQVECAQRLTVRYSSDDLEYYKLEYQTLMVEAEATRTEYQQCTQNTLQLELKVVEAEAAAATAKRELERLAEDVEGETKKLADELSETYETLLRVQDDSAVAIAAYRDEVETLKMVLSQADADKVSAVEELTGLERVRAAEQEEARVRLEELKEVYKAVEELRNNEVNFRGQIDELTEKLALLSKTEENYVQAQGQLAALQLQLQLSHEENAGLKDSLAKLEASLQAAIERGAAELRAKEQVHTKQLIERLVEMSAIEANYSTSQAAVDSLKADNSQLQEQLETCEAEALELKSKFIESLTNREEVVRQMSLLRDQDHQKSLENAELRGKFELVSIRNAQLLKEIEALNKENERLGGHANLSQKIKLHSKLKEENNKLKTANYKLNEDLRKTKLKLDTVTKKFQELSRREGLAEVDLNEELRLRQEIGDLTEELGRVRTGYALIGEQLGDLCGGGEEELLERTVGGIQALRQQVQASLTQLADKDLEIASLSTQVKLLTNEMLLQGYKANLETRPQKEASSRQETRSPLSASNRRV